MSYSLDGTWCNTCQCHSVLQDLWVECIDCTKDTEMKARILGVEAQMKTFRYVFEVMLGETILKEHRQFE